MESQLLATFGKDPLRLHLNAGGFYDARPANAEHGWRASALAPDRAVYHPSLGPRFSRRADVVASWPEGEVDELPLLSKRDVAAQLFDRIEKLLRGRA